jgi:hypothetical protein
MYFNQIGSNPLKHVSFIFNDYKMTLTSYSDWMRPILERNGLVHSYESLSSSLEVAIDRVNRGKQMAPSTFGFIKIGESQVLYCDNTRDGGTVVPVTAVLSDRLGCGSIRVLDFCPEEVSLLFESYNRSKHPSRTISWIDDGNGHELLESGNPHPDEIAIWEACPKSLNSFKMQNLARLYDTDLDLDPEMLVDCCLFHESKTTEEIRTVPDVGKAFLAAQDT